MSTAPHPVCVGCKRPPEGIGECVSFAKNAGVSPAQYVRSEDGTYNPRNGHFLCDECLIAEENRIGRTLTGPHGTPWVAP